MTEPNELLTVATVPYLLVALLASSFATMPRLRRHTEGGTYSLLAAKTPMVVYFLDVSPAIKRRRALLDITTVAVGALISLWLPLYAAAPALCLFAALCAVCHIDLRTMRLPHHLTQYATVSALVLAGVLATSVGGFFLAALAGLLFALTFFTLGVLRPGSIGFGDVLLALSTGTLTGAIWGLWALPFAFITTGLSSAVLLVGLLILNRGRISSGLRVPFGIHIAIGSVLATLIGVLFAADVFDPTLLPAGVLRI